MLKNEITLKIKNKTKHVKRLRTLNNHGIVVTEQMENKLKIN